LWGRFQAGDNQRRSSALDPSMATVFDARLRALRRRVAQAAYVGELSTQLLVALFASGTLVLLARLLLGWELERAVWICSLALVTPFTAWWRARGRFLSAEGAANWLDVRTGATGIVVTETEVADERWMARAEEVLASRRLLPAVRVQPMTIRSFAGVGFALLALLVPIPDAQPLTPANLFDSSLEALHEKLQALEEELEFEDEVAAELEAQLDRLEAEAEQALNPEATFEAIDQLARRLEQEALEAQAAAQEADEALADAAQAAEQEQAAALSESLARTTEVLELSGMLETLPRELQESLDLSASQAAEGLKLDPAALEELSAGMRGLLETKLGKLAEAGLLEAGTKLGKLGESAGLGAFQFSQHECDENCKLGPGGT